jgi:four helix bundle protein
MVRGRKLIGGLQGQLQRAASSVVLNLNEGWGRASAADRRRFFQIAFGSIREVQSIVQLEYESFTNTERETLDHLAASVFKLLQNYKPNP